MQLETCWRLEDGGIQNHTPTSRHGPTKFDQSLSSNVTTSLGSVFQILRIKSKNHTEVGTTYERE